MFMGVLSQNGPEAERGSPRYAVCCDFILTQFTAKGNERCVNFCRPDPAKAKIFLAFAGGLRYTFSRVLSETDEIKENPPCLTHLLCLPRPMYSC